MAVLAHYLEIEWESVGAPRQVKVSTYPIKIETAPNGTLYAEVSIFRDFAPWVGLRLTGDLADVEPFTINAQNERFPWLRVFDEHGGAWWIPATGWSKPNKKHISETHRSFGSFSVELGHRQKLVLDAVALELDRAHAQEYLDDFTDELVWLAIGRPTGALGQVGSDNSRDMVDALGAFADAAGRVLEHPVREIREVTASAPAARLRPNAETFRAAMRQPGTRTYPSRAARESVDVPENRYLRSMVEHCRRLARSVARSSVRHQAHLAARAAREKTRAAELRATKTIEVDQEIFDNQISEIRRRLDAIDRWVEPANSPGPAEQKYRLKVGKEFSRTSDPKEFFYRNPDRDEGYDERARISFSVARLPVELHNLVRAAYSFDKDLELTLTGTAKISTFQAKNDKLGRRAIFTQISNVKAHSPVLERRETARSRYERNGWHRPIFDKEREEYRLEADTALARAGHFSGLVQSGKATSTELSVIANSLDHQDAGWNELKVISSPMFPMGMRFFQNPLYAAALAAFQKVSALEQRSGLNEGTLDKLGRINTLHASALYERWCLIKIIAVLMQDFAFVPQDDWVEHVVTSVSGSGIVDGRDFSISFTRAHPRMTARLDAEPVLANGRRPDFRLRFATGSDLPLHGRGDESEWSASRSIFRNQTRQHSGLVMDAKFRTRWKPTELPTMLRLLVDTKGYGQDGDRVFILQPARASIERRTAPLIWGRDCDYGQEHPTNHSHGSIQLAATPGSGDASLNNLRRLIALQLQQEFPEPESGETDSGSASERDGRRAQTTEICRSNASFCINCGESHNPADITPERTERGNRKWYYKCSRCGTGTMQTRCFGCGTFLFKNGLKMTYHLTVADQLSNVVCHECGSGF